MRLHHSDPGLQPERTSLSWTRTTVSLSVVSMILVRWAWVYGPWVFALVGILLALAATIYLTQQARYQADVQGLISEVAPTNILSILVLTGSLWVLGAGAIALVLAP